MQNLRGWLANERLEILARRQAIIDHFPIMADKGWNYWEWALILHI